MKKYFVIICLAVFAGLYFAGCGSSGGGETTTTTTVQGATTTTAQGATTTTIQEATTTTTTSTTSTTSTNPGSGTWSAVGTRGFSTGSAEGVAIACDESNGSIYVACVDRGKGDKLYVMRFDGADWVEVGSGPVTSEAVSISENDVPSLIVNNGIPYAAFITSPGADLLVRKYSGGAWVDVGSLPVSGSAGYCSLQITGETPYVATNDFGLMKVFYLNGATWDWVNSSLVSLGSNHWLSLAMLGTTPYVAFRDANNNSRATVKYSPGGSWATLGGAGFGVESDSVVYTSLAINSSNNIFVAFKRNAVSPYKAVVMKYNSTTTSWEAVGAEGISDGEADLTRLKCFGQDLYLSYKDMANQSGITTLLYDHSSAGWYVLGTAAFSGQEADLPALTVDPNGTPYVAFQDGQSQGKLTVMKFTGN
ncbi:hypothetical protein A2311_02405 [candidate division WOR-1 bacterium RIFOXYB2_FULL_48_7]|uniref:Uncharacterized protein n=1 Tax=candidate division WOR-1 bacterium RIFOXYB2_FULL_48_7 TaxID=1802583 RepID=A0A1F4TUL5_UNCSA|nr:MAG: hypothetical protein A2311_02405 [candidate division WOR-1 bacterium RIFOXYB2_FULL_48_7]